MGLAVMEGNDVKAGRGSLGNVQIKQIYVKNKTADRKTDNCHCHHHNP